ncbi:MAG: SRPBCC family protein, partial [Kineosporiaceae bacterium]
MEGCELAAAGSGVGGEPGQAQDRLGAMELAGRSLRDTRRYRRRVVCAPAGGQRDQVAPYAQGVRTCRLETRIEAPLAACFDLSLSVDAHTASMIGSGERAISGVTTGTMGLGDAVTWRARHFGVPFTMTSVITAHDFPHRFVDEQAHGPFAFWWHEHTFTALDPDVTLMVDVV